MAEFWTFGGDLHSMKNIIETSALLACVLVAGCAGDGFNRSTDRSQSPLTAEELSRLLDLHVYKARIPPSQQPFRSLRLILIKNDGSSLKEYAMIPLNRESYTGILLGLRFEHGAISGALEVTGPKGRRLALPLYLEGRIRWWYGGNPQWEGNRIQLATVSDAEDTNHSGLSDADNRFSTLALELVK